MRKPKDGWLSAQLSKTNSSEVATGEEEAIIRQQGALAAACAGSRRMKKPTIDTRLPGTSTRRSPMCSAQPKASATCGGTCAVAHIE